ncbi:hypothetical protein BST61_g1485 [Cercospora zeina]
MRKSNTRPNRTPRAFAVSNHEQVDCDVEYIRDLFNRDRPTETVIVIENINKTWITSTAAAWDISQAFFTKHGENPPAASSPWSAIFGTNDSKLTKGDGFWHVDGVFQYGLSSGLQLRDANSFNRLLALDHTYGWQMTTRISCLNMKLKGPPIVLLLVDAPAESLGRDKGQWQPQPGLHLSIGDESRWFGSVKRRHRPSRIFSRSLLRLSSSCHGFTFDKLGTEHGHFTGQRSNHDAPTHLESWTSANQFLNDGGYTVVGNGKRQATTSARETIEMPQSYYSPGECPSGCVSAAGTYDDKNYFNTCCPSSMSVISSSCTSAADTITYIEGTDTWLQTVRSALAPSIVVAYQSSDLSLWATPESTSALSAASTSRPTETLASPTTTTTSEPRPSTGARAGIGTGVTGVVIVIFLVLGLYIRRRMKGSNDDSSSNLGKAELSGDGVHRELSGEGAMYEKSDVVKLVEIDNETPAELDGDWRGWEVGSPQGHLTVSERNV